MTFFLSLLFIALLTASLVSLHKYRVREHQRAVELVKHMQKFYPTYESSDWDDWR